MDEVRAFFNTPNAPAAQVHKLRGPLTGGQRITKNDSINALNRCEKHRQSVLVSGTDYAREIKARETAIYLRNDRERSNFECYNSGGLNSGCLDSLEHLTSWGSSAQNMLNEEKLTEEAMNEVYSKYSFQMREDTKGLAINAYRDEILNRIKAFPVVIIEGPTGCGKTTQVPQWILDDAYNSRKPCKIIVTQPRKIAAISIARRVAQERGWDVGGLVGYQIGLENRTTSDTRIHYVTTGVLLQKLVMAKNMNEYTHIILDEVHERGQEMDFLMLVVKKFLYTVSPLVRVILMSATFNCETFANYFLIPMADTRQQASFLKITVNEPTFSVKTFYLDDLQKYFGVNEKATPKGNEAAILPEMYHLVINLIEAFEKIDKTEEYTDRSEADLPSVLIFLPGIFEIEELYACLMDNNLRIKVAGAECATYQWWVLPLHSTITADEQVRVFKRAPPGHRKIILATNIAESSITVPDVKYVIDFCLMKVLVADQHTNFTSLQLKWASKTNCEQRAGRAGRVRDGRVYRLVNNKAYQDLLQECEPEILRCPLERLVLIAKMLDMGQPSDILALAMNPPDISNVQRTILVLKEAGALKKTLYGEWSDSDGDITYLGRIMAKLPLDVKVSKLIMLGYIFGCLEESIIMAAGMSVKNVFSSPFRERLNAYNSKLTWADGSTSDCIAILNVYKVWNHLRQQNYFKQPGNSEVSWARRFYVQIRSLRELDDMVKEIRMRLSREGIDPNTRISPWNKHEQPLILKVILAGAFYPQYFVQVSTDEARERDAVKALGGLDPRNSVYLRGFPDGQPGEVYAAAIKNIVIQQIGDEPRVTFDKNGRKVFLTFQDNQNLKSDQKGGDPTIPGQVVLPVYKAIKARHLKMDIRIPLLPIEKANALAAAIAELKKNNMEISKMVPRLPEIDDTHFPLLISQLINIGRFWVQYADESTASELRMIQVTLNRKPLLAYTHSVAVDTLVAAPYSDANGTLLFRARVTRLLPKEMVEVSYIDYGSMGRVGSCGLRELPEECSGIPPLAMQCVLTNIAPAPLLHAHAQWSPHAVRLFTEMVSKGRLLGKIYSVAHGVISIELLAEGGKVNVNKVLLEKGFAVPCEESYDSKLNHDLRQTATELNLAQKRALNKEQAELAFNHLHEIAPPNYKECISAACLKGPDSPLESALHNLMYASREKMVSVEWNSVNSVLLDTEPQEMYERLLVAADVGQNELSSKLTLRHTTLLPNIRGLPAIISLLFCPEAELRRANDKSRYVSVLCGLGSDEDESPRFPEHDLLVNIDADLSVSDIGLINHIRYLMDYVMFCNEGEDVPSTQDDIRPKIPNFIRDDLMKLLQKRRKRREPQCVVNAWEWKSIPEDDLLEITIPDMLQKAVVYPPHTPIEIDELPREVLLAMKRENEELKMLVGRTSTSSSELVCKLCATPAMPAHAMRIHLCSNAHLDKEEDFRHLES
ncbi:probable ATP-dependent RNA helicase spindle-E [Maniola hyperantus]|uniref:probable ATP-dependent RNA helicase spindle-E n=1 Tax=Aphantopus hyperantus TaxID=2795564 RepID=UPI00156A5C33|nr:probable ATP-dependent RNA helicase spindle-E [Maniola hyperantus]